MTIRQTFLSVLLVGFLALVGCDKPGDSAKSPNGSGDAKGAAGPTTADPKEVAFEPQKFAGKTLEGRFEVRGGSSVESATMALPHGGQGMFELRFPSKEIREKTWEAQGVGGLSGVVVTYKVDENVAKDANKIPKGNIGVVVDVRIN